MTLRMSPSAARLSLKTNIQGQNKRRRKRPVVFRPCLTAGLAINELTFLEW